MKSVRPRLTLTPTTEGTKNKTVLFGNPKRRIVLENETSPRPLPSHKRFSFLILLGLLLNRKKVSLDRKIAPISNSSEKKDRSFRLLGRYTVVYQRLRHEIGRVRNFISQKNNKTKIFC